MTSPPADATPTMPMSPIGAKVTSTTVYGIQILRGLAATIVVVRHIAKELASPGAGGSFETGQFGVDIFFVISGFVIFLTGPKLSASEFIERRLVRVVPLYWIVLSVTILGDVVRHNIDRAFVVKNALLSFFFIPSHDHVGSMFPPLVVGWSLNFEMFFYVIAAALLAFGSKRFFLRNLIVTILSLVLVGAALRTQVSLSSAPFTILLLPLILEFLAGAVIARWWVRGFNLHPGAALLLFALAAVWMAVSPSQFPYSVFRPFAWGVPAVATVVATLALERWLRARALAPLHRLGDISYSLYLVHPIVIGVVLMLARGRLADVPFAAALFFVAVVCIVAGFFTHHVLERPLLRVTRHVTTRRSRPGPATSPLVPASGQKGH